MSIIEILLAAFVLTVIAVFGSKHLSKIANKALIDGLNKEIDRLYRLHNYSICKDDYVESDYEKQVTTDLHSINANNCKLYKETFGVERIFRQQGK